MMETTENRYFGGNLVLRTVCNNLVLRTVCNECGDRVYTSCTRRINGEDVCDVCADNIMISEKVARHLSLLDKSDAMKNNSMISKIVRDEIRRCKVLQEYYADKGTSGGTIIALIGADIQKAEKAIEENDVAAMYRALGQLRANNLFVKRETK